MNLTVRLATVFLLTLFSFMSFVGIRSMFVSSITAPEKTSVGLEPVPVAVVCLILMLLVCWVAFVWELPSVLANLRARRRLARGRCGQCDYPLETDCTRCTECGCELVPPRPLELSLQWVERAVLLLVGCWLLGVSVGEGWIQLDQRDASIRLIESRAVDPEVEQIMWDRRWPGIGELRVRWRPLPDAGE